ncbi:MAG TPA: tyrosine-type recombinase/integrase [Xanthomonadales bacterium]|nr:tyrosine-type recombinase/integrase [Xanthomonadales bacterium]
MAELNRLGEWLPPVAATQSSACLEGAQEFLLLRLPNANTRLTYTAACGAFVRWALGQSVTIEAVRPVHIAAYAHQLAQRLAPMSVAVHLTAIRRMYGWLVERQLLASNPAAATRSARRIVHSGSTPALTPAEVAQLFARFREDRPHDLRDRALISLMLYGFLRISAVLALRREDVDLLAGPALVQVLEKGGMLRSIPLHARAHADLVAYLAKVPRARGELLFGPLSGKRSTAPGKPMRREQVYAMIRRRLSKAGIDRVAGCHAFRTTGITRFLAQGGRIEVAAHLAGHVSLRTTQLYDRRQRDAAAAELALLSF